MEVVTESEAHGSDEGRNTSFINSISQKRGDNNDENELNSLVINDLPWIEKYRPKSLQELIAHEEIVNICT